MAFIFRTKYGWDEQPTEPVTITPPGFYPTKIVAADEKFSKSGKPMLQLTLEIDPGGAKTFDVKEYLLLDPKSAWKLEQYLAAIGVQFQAGQDITIDANMFLGGQCYVLTYNEPGQKNPERLYIKPLKAFRPQDVKLPGALPPDKLERWGLNPDGTLRSQNEQPKQPAQSGWGQPAQSGWGQTPPPAQQGWAQPSPPQPAQMPHEEEDDIPF